MNSIKYVNSKVASTGPRWLKYITQTIRSPKARIIFFHYAGGNSNSFIDWSEYFDAEIELLSVELPGRASRFIEPFATDIYDVVSAISKEIKELSNLPQIFFGHSMGSIISYLTVKKLMEEGAVLPKTLVVSGRGAPDIDGDKVSNYAKMSDEELICYLKDMSGTPDEIFESQEMTSIFLPIIRADFALVDSYRYERNVTQIPCDIICLHGDQERDLKVEDVESWRRYTSCRFSCFRFSGGHFFIHSHMGKITKLLQEVLYLKTGGFF